MNLWLKSLHRYAYHSPTYTIISALTFSIEFRYSVSNINTYPTVTNAITIVTSLAYGWTSDYIKLRSPIVFFSLTICFFAAVNLAVWDGVPFGLKWASYYLTG